ncbi:MAG: acylphosphatase [Candidatus Thermoplasmatota archaeon]
MADARAHVRFFGRVQGVFFRDNTLRRALALGVMGWVRNLSDGSVEAIFEGSRAKVEEIIAWCVTSQPYARVERHEVIWEAPKGARGFEVRL